jgi:hypothetical protein
LWRLARSDRRPTGEFNLCKCSGAFNFPNLRFDTAASAPFNLWTFDVTVAMKRKQIYQKKNRSKT